jgi:phosphoglucosamine mutase
MSLERKFFGTDGVRGPYGGLVVNEAFFARLAFAAGRWALNRRVVTSPSPLVALMQPKGSAKLRDKDSVSSASANAGKNKVLVGRDTRASGAALTQAATAGLRVAGLLPVDLGVLPTPAIALAVRDGGAVLGVVITASHNPAGDNGIKFFKRGGLKLSDEEEAQIEALLPSEPEQNKMFELAFKEFEKREASGFFTETNSFDDVATERYASKMVKRLAAETFRGWVVALDTAKGATGMTSPFVLEALGAAVDHIGVEGADINDHCGSEHPEKMCAAVREHGARLGIAHDGDGDRCVLCDEYGEVLDGDEVLTILALHALRVGRLAADTLVVTVQSNLGVDAALAAAGGRVVRTPVGDRHVAEKMRELGATLGGESSGHIICADVSPTGDGLIAALRVMEVMRATGQPLSELRRWLKKFPQASTTVAIAPGAPKPPLETMSQLTAAIRVLEAELGARGRVLARWSGTEPKLRLLVEGPDDVAVRDGLARLAAAARADLGV